MDNSQTPNTPEQPHREQPIIPAGDVPHGPPVGPKPTANGEPPPPIKVEAPEEVPLTPKDWLIQNSPYLIIIVAGVILLVSKMGLEALPSAFLTIFGIGFIIFVHELGHFMVAKWCDVHVLTFSIGFGPAIPGCSFKRGETTYKLSLLPLGGYVNMVGEGSDADEEENYPRSFKNKTVGQRMAIISAGVIMNILFGILGFIFVFLTKGMERTAPTVGGVDAGSTAWVQGVKSGWRIKAINGKEIAVFDDLRRKVALSKKDRPMEFQFIDPDRPDEVITRILEPSRKSGTPHPVIGVTSAKRLELAEMEVAPKSKQKTGVFPDSPAAKAVTDAGAKFQPRDIIVACTDPETFKVSPLPDDKRHPEKKVPDPFEFERRMRLLAGRTVVIEVRQHDDQAGTTLRSIEVEPNYHLVIPGVRMQIGEVGAVRARSEAAKHVHPSFRNENENRKGDRIKSAEIRVVGGTTLIRLVDAPEKEGPLKENEKLLDPLRLRHDLASAAAKVKGEKEVVLTVLRGQGNVADAPQELKAIPWDESWSNNDERPRSAASLLSIPELGIAYWVTSRVHSVDLNAKAGQEGLRVADVIKGIATKRRADAKPDAKEIDRWEEWDKLKGRDEEEGEDPRQWAYVFELLQQPGLTEIGLQVQREKDKDPEVVVVSLAPDKDWPTDKRGFVFIGDTWIQKADNVGEAVVLGLGDTWNLILDMYTGLSRLMSGDVAKESLGGPIAIVETTFKVAHRDVHALVHFLAILSINLAVVNFIPIPLLDGGHMVFLIYEKLRGKPASERVRNIANLIGVAMLLLLIAFVFYNDIRRIIVGD